MLTEQTLERMQRALTDAKLDGWLLFDFRGLNPVVRPLLGLDEGMMSRRVFALVPREGVPVAITHAIEQGPWVHWPQSWGREVYSTWRALESLLAKYVRGKRVAMEYSPGDAVPYVDRIPAGVLEMVRAAGAEVVSSGELISLFYAAWSPAGIASHHRAAEAIAAIARETMMFGGAEVRAGRTITEHALQRRILEAFERAGLETEHRPNVSVNANAANPHYEPTSDHTATLRTGDVMLIDLWAREKNGGVWADQTWMSSLGTPGPRAMAVWTAVRDARDAAIALLRDRVKAGEPVRGGELDDAARGVIVDRGFGPRFTHRTGHSIDSRDLHGSGPNIDNVETREQRLLIPGVGFSIEPGVYFAGEIGMRTEVNAYIGDGEAVITPLEYQRELTVV
jgi:Xaa-Pro dipeptidase